MIGSSILVIHRGWPPLLVRIWCASGPKRLVNFSSRGHFRPSDAGAAGQCRTGGGGGPEEPLPASPRGWKPTTSGRKGTGPVIRLVGAKRARHCRIGRRPIQPFRP